MWAASGAGLLTRNGGSASGWEDYSLRLTYTAAPTASSNIAAVAWLCDPSNLPLTEWSTFAALFDEVKVTGFEVHLAVNNGAGSSANITYCGMGAFTRTTSTPASLQAVLVSPNSCLVAPNAVRPAVLKMKVPRDLLFASTASPGGIPSAGCPGSIQLYADTKGASDVVGLALIVARYHLRGRL
jgi:hypothetical protein